MYNKPIQTAGCEVISWKMTDTAQCDPYVLDMLYRGHQNIVKHYPVNTDFAKDLQMMILIWTGLKNAP